MFISGAVGYSGPSSSNSDNTLVLNSFECNGNEPNLLNCSHTKGTYCYHGEAKVNCTGRCGCTSGNVASLNNCIFFGLTMLNLVGDYTL